MQARKSNASIKKAAPRVVYVRLREPDFKRLQQLADAEFCPVSTVVRRAVEAFLSKNAAA